MTKIFVSLLFLAASSYPLYAAIDVIISGGLGERCMYQPRGIHLRGAGGGTGAFCQWGPTLGKAMFGPDNAHLGYALLLGCAWLVFALFILWAVSGQRADRGDDGA